MPDSRTTERVILLVLLAMTGTLLVGEALLDPSGKDRDRTVLAEKRNASVSGEGEFRSQGANVEATKIARHPKDTSPAVDDPNPKPEAEPGRVNPDADSAVDSKASTVIWSGAVRLQGEVRSRDSTIPSQVTWRPLNSRGDEEVRVVETDSEGNYAVTLTRPGPHLVEIHPKAFFDEVSANGVELIVEIPSQAVARWNLVLPGGTLEGSLRSQAGQPVVDAFLELVSVQESFGCSSTDLSPRRSMSDEEGHFRFEFLAPGDYAVSTAWNPTGEDLDEDEASPGARILARSQLASISEDGHAVIDLQLPGPTPNSSEEPKPLPSIRVLENGQPYLGASVWYRRIDQPTLRGQLIGTTGRDGSLVLPDLRGNPGALLVAKGERSMSVPKPLDANATSIDLVLQAAGSLRVITRDKDGNSLAASVEVRSTDAERVGDNTIDNMVWARDSSQIPARSGSLGTEAVTARAQRELGPLLPGTYLVRAWTSDGRRASTEVTLEADDRPSTLIMVLGMESDPDR